MPVPGTSGIAAPPALDGRVLADESQTEVTPRQISARPGLWRVLPWVIALCVLGAVLHTGLRSPFTRFVLPQYSLGYFWDTPLGWTGEVDGTPTNRDSVQFATLSSFLRDEPVLPLDLDGIVYTRMSGYALLGTVLAPLLGRYGGFVAFNTLAWIAGALATYALARRRTDSDLVAGVAAALVATAPAFYALVGQALPYVASYGLFAVGVWFCEAAGLFERGTPRRRVAAIGFTVGASFLLYDLFMLPAFVVLYGLLRRMPWRRLGLCLLALAIPRGVWTVYWRLMQLPNYTQNSDHPLEALFAWVEPARYGAFPQSLLALGALGGHLLLNVTAVFLFLPVLFALAAVARRRWGLALGDWQWYLAVLLAGFGPAAFMLSTWPHLPRWYAYGFVATYILAAIGLVDLAGWLARRIQPVPSSRLLGGIAVALLVPLVLLANLDLLGETRPMELLLFQPQQWAYLWRR